MWQAPPKNNIFGFNYNIYYNSYELICEYILIEILSADVVKQ